MNIKTLTDKQIRIRLDQFLRERIKGVVKHPVVDRLSKVNGGRKLTERKNSGAVNATNCMRVCNSCKMSVVGRGGDDKKLTTHIVSKCDCDTISGIFIIWVVANEKSRYCMIPSWCGHDTESAKNNYEMNCKKLAL
jgi:hypothetical protein